MKVFYFDTSALVKHYIKETGSEWVTTILHTPENQVFTSWLTSIEAACTFARRRREGTLLHTDYTDVLNMFDYHFTYRYTVLDVNPEVMSRARCLADRHPLRAYDAMQLASAYLVYQDLFNSSISPLTFVCADDRLLTIAQAEGLLTENPNQHL